jgi:hypothetical protein
MRDDGAELPNQKLAPDLVFVGIGVSSYAASCSRGRISGSVA